MVAATLVVGGAVTGVLSLAEPAAAADAVDRVVDPPTWHDFPGSDPTQGYYNISRSPGRIWTDKTVFDTTVEDPGREVPPLEVGTNETAVALSAIGSTRHVSREEPIPIDASLVVDLSGSMRSCIDNPSTNCITNSGAGSRAEALVEATNSALRIILGADPDNRVALTSFGNSTGTLIGLGRPEPIGQDAAGDDIYMRLCNAGGNLYVTFAANGCPASNRTEVVGGTNIERGIYRGMNILATQTGVAGERIPSVLLMSDGEPTYSVAANAQGGTSSPQWWNIPSNGAGRDNVGPGNAGYSGNGFMAALTAQYFKNIVNENYATSADLGTDARVYTVAFGLDSLSAESQALARVTLDPADELGSTTNTYAADFRTWFAQYRAGGGTGTIPCVLVNRTGSTDVCLTNVGHPTSATGGVPAADPTTLAYNDAFYSPVTAEDLEEAFTQIATSITEAPPNFPIDIENNSPATSGYLTMTDELGPFMEVKILDRIAFCSSIRESPTSEPDPNDCDAQTFVATGSTTEGDVTTYTFEGTYEANDVAGPANVGDVIVQVVRNPALAVGDTVIWRVPASLLPLRDTNVVEDADGTPTSVSIIPSHPVHLLFTVGPKDGVTDALGDTASLGASDGAALAQYVAENTDDAGNVRFYTNAFETGTDGITAQTNAQFRPADRNAFYRFAADTTLYTAQSTDAPLSFADFESDPADTTYYYPQVEYSNVDGPAKSTFWVATTKQQLLDSEDEAHQVSGVAGTAFAPAGMFALTERTNNLDEVKCTPAGSAWDTSVPVCNDANPGVDGNYTETADYVRLSPPLAPESQTLQQDLGNNGYVAFATPGTLRIDKTVVADPALEPDQDATFEFTVDLTADGAALEGDFPYTLYQDGVSDPVETGRIASGGTVSLTVDQYVTIGNLPAGATYTVTETPPASGFTQTSPTGPATGTIETAAEATATFENTYTATAVTLATPSATKVLEPWPAGLTFDATLCGSGVPLPEGAGADGCVTVELTAADPTAAFGDIVFESPGQYQYAITETRSTAAGVTSSAAQYQWTVQVSDNGTGELTATVALVRVADDAGVAVSEPVAGGSPATFTNSFSATETSISLPAAKMVRDLSLPGSEAEQMRFPALSHTAEFTALGVTPDDVPVPAPTGCTSPCQVSNTPGSPDLSSPQITFGETDVNHTFYYSVREVADPTRPFVDYDTSAYVYRVSVTAVDTDEGAVVDATLATCETTATALEQSTYGDCDPTTGTYTEGQTADFVNVYEPAAGTTDLTATKSFQGRPWLDGDSFEFQLVPAPGATSDAVAAGTVTLPGGNPWAVTVSDPAQPTATFAGLSFSQQGSYQFLVTETVPADTRGITYDTHTLVYDVSVTNVTVDGELEVQATPRGGQGQQTFTNTYAGAVTVAGVEIDKTLTGRDQRAGEFVFDIVPADQAAADKAGIPLTGAELATQSDARPGETIGQQLLGTVQYTQADLGSTYTYTVTERQGTTTGGVEYDDATWTVTRAAQYDPETAGLYVLTTVTGPDGATQYDSRTSEVPVVSFANAYSAQPTTATVGGSKTITGRGWLEGETFRFQLTPQDDAPAPADDTVTVAGDAAAGQAVPFEFEPITYDTAGEFRYVIAELAPDDGEGLSYDRHPSLATVTVTDDGEGSLVAAVTYDTDEDFVNMYSSQYTAAVELAKTLLGRDLEAGEFTFDVVPQDSGAAAVADLPEEGSSLVNAEGAADGEPSVTDVLPAVFLTQADAGQTYCYAMTERAGSLPDVRYDPTAYDVCLAVADNGRGVITVTTTVTGSDGTEVVTENSSDADPAGPWPLVPFTNIYEEPTPPPGPEPTPPPDAPDVPVPPDDTTPGWHLPSTGAAVLGLLALALLLAMLGALLVRDRRRRDGSAGS
ncbi:LPXTG cell wall anchor domain-containing protein [Georgenia wutianyii]|uniref:LPXTG cell wall anchor domain-containing protein n=1 Tax=Georgenia wutianyii TaxID=2585135 RepID=A0ABX5VPH7_9MICO|nr:FctA domain-containing protein [Georgenia wutianyii]QDB79283.1 LPXTG cell wall anchor domain-containing protein [Georgenia wutianyii]